MQPEAIMYDQTVGMSNPDGALAILAAYMGTILLIAFIATIVMTIIKWKIFTKAGYAGWKSLIPFYNRYILYELAWGHGWLFVLTLIPATAFISVLTHARVAKAFDKDYLFEIGSAFLPAIFWGILAFGSSEYVGYVE